MAEITTPPVQIGRLLTALGTITADAKVVESTVTLNNAAVTFTAWKLNVTDTASAAASLLVDLQVGGASKFSVTKAGAVSASVGGVTGHTITKDASADNRYLRLVNSQATGKSWDLIVQTVAGGGNFLIYNHTDSTSPFTLTPAGAGTFLAGITATTGTFSSNISVPATFAYYLNGQGGDSYITEATGDRANFIIGGALRFSIVDTGALIATGALSGVTTFAASNTTDANALTITPTHATYTQSAVRIAASRAASSAYYMIYATANGVEQFSVTGAGTVAAATAFHVSGTKVVGAQGAAVADASGGATIDAEARTALNALLARVRTHGLIAT